MGLTKLLSIQDSVKVSLKSYVVFTYPEDILILMLDYNKNTEIYEMKL